MKNAITVIAFVVMNGAAFLGYRATASAPAATVEKPAPPPAHKKPVEPAAAAPAPVVEPPSRTLEPQITTPEIVAVPNNSAELTKAPAPDSSDEDSSQGALKRSRADVKRGVRNRADDVRPAAEPPRVTTPARPPPPPAPPAPPPAAADDKKRLLDEMESNPYKRSD